MAEENVRDELDEARKRDRPEESATREAVEEERTGGSGGVKDNVKDEGEESQRR